MAVVDLIQEKVKLLSRQEDVLWSKLSLRWALRGLEDEEWPEYDAQDLKEKWG